MSGHLMVEVVKAEGLLKKDWFASDPYVVVSFSSGSNHAEQQTDYKSNTLNPVYSRKFQFKACEQCDLLTFTVYDHDVLGPHEYMGEAHIWVGSQSKAAKLGYVDDQNDEDDDDGTEESPEKVAEKKKLQKLERLKQPGIYQHTPAGVDHPGLTIPLLDKDNDWQDAGTITIKWVYSYSSFGGLFAARLDELTLSERKTREVLPEFDFDVLKGNLDRIEKRVGELLSPLKYIGDVLNWQSPAESCLWFVIVTYLLRWNLLPCLIPFACALAMVKNWYTWWRWGPAGPPVCRWELPADPHRGSDSDTISNDDDDSFVLTKLKKLGAKAQKATGEVVDVLDRVSDTLMWKRPGESAVVTLALLGATVLLAIPYLFTLVGMIIAPVWPYAANIAVVYMFTLFPLYNQFPYLKKYYQIDDVIELLIFTVVHAVQSLPARLSYSRARSSSLKHLRRTISPELLDLINLLDSAYVNPEGAAHNVLGLLRLRLFHPDARSPLTLARRKKDGVPAVQYHEQLLVWNAMRRQPQVLVEFFDERECSPDTVPPTWKVRRAFERGQLAYFTSQLAVAMSDTIKMELIARTTGGVERDAAPSANGQSELQGDPLWLPQAAAHYLHSARIGILRLEIARAKEAQKRERVRKYGDKLVKKPRLTVNVLNCRGLISKEKGKRVTSRITYVRVTLGKHSVVTDKKRHSTAPQFRSQCKFGFDPDGGDAFDPRAAPFLRIELFDEDRKGPFGQLEIDIRKLPRKEETKERYYNLRRRGNEVVGQIALSFYAEGFGVETIKFDKDVVRHLGDDIVLQRMYWQAVRALDPTLKRSDCAPQLARSATLPAECAAAVQLEHISPADLRILHPEGDHGADSGGGDAEGHQHTHERQRRASGGTTALTDSALGVRDRAESSDPLSRSLSAVGGFQVGGGPSPPRERPGAASPKVQKAAGVGIVPETAEELRDEITLLRRMIEDTKALVEDDDRRIRELGGETQSPAAPGCTPPPRRQQRDADEETVGSDISFEIQPPHADRQRQQQQQQQGSDQPQALRPQPLPPPADPGGRRGGAPEEDRRKSLASVAARRTLPGSSEPGSETGGHEAASSTHTPPQAAEQPRRRDSAPPERRTQRTLWAAAAEPGVTHPAAPAAAAAAAPPSSARRDSRRASDYDDRVSRDVHRELDRVVRQEVPAVTGGAEPRPPQQDAMLSARGGPESARTAGDSARMATARSTVSTFFYCDGCSTADSPQYCQGVRYNCLDSADYDLCEHCFRYNCDAELLNPARFRRIPIRPEEEAARGVIGEKVSHARARVCESRLQNDSKAEAHWTGVLRELCLYHPDEVPPGVDAGEGLSAAERHAGKRSYRSASGQGPALYGNPLDGAPGPPRGGDLWAAAGPQAHRGHAGPPR